MPLLVSSLSVDGSLGGGSKRGSPASSARFPEALETWLPRPTLLPVPSHLRPLGFGPDTVLNTESERGLRRTRRRVPILRRAGQESAPAGGCEGSTADWGGAHPGFLLVNRVREGFSSAPGRGDCLRLGASTPPCYIWALGSHQVSGLCSVAPEDLESVVGEKRGARM